MVTNKNFILLPNEYRKIPSFSNINLNIKLNIFLPNKHKQILTPSFSIVTNKNFILLLPNEHRKIPSFSNINLNIFLPNKHKQILTPSFSIVTNKNFIILLPNKYRKIHSFFNKDLFPTNTNRFSSPPLPSSRTKNFIFFLPPFPWH